MKLKSASLDLIATANNKPTGDQLRGLIEKEEFEKLGHMTHNQRRNYRRTMRKLEQGQ